MTQVKSALARFDGLAQRLETVFLWFLILNPVLDIVSSLVYYFIQEWRGVTLSLAVRLVLMVLMACYLLIRWDWKGLMLVIPAGVVAVLSMVMAYCFGIRYNILLDMQYAARYLLNLLCIASFLPALLNHYKLDRKKAVDALINIMILAACLYALTIIVCFILDVGLPTVGNRFGSRGNRAYFYAGNEIAAIMMVIFPFSLYRFTFIPLKECFRRRHILHTLAPGLIGNAMFIIGTKTCLFALALFLVLMLGYAVVRWIRAKDGSYVRQLLAALVIVVLVFGLLTLLTSSRMAISIRNTTKQINTERDAAEVDTDAYKDHFEKSTGRNYDEVFSTPLGRAIQFLLSNRQFKLMDTAEQWAQGNVLTVLFGTGRSTHLYTVEMDFFEIFFYYGIVGFVIFLWPFVYLFARLFKKLTQGWDYLGFVLLSAILTIAGYSFLSGHVLFTATGGFYLAVILVTACYHYGIGIERVWPYPRGRAAKEMTSHE